MSNVFSIDQDGYDNSLTIDADTSVSGSFEIDGYVIVPDGAVDGQVLQYNGSAFVPATLQESDIENLTSDLAALVPNTRNINTVSGELVGGGSLASNLNLGLAVSGVSAGTYTSVVVDAYGRVTSGSNPSSGITGTFANDQVIYGNSANSTVQGSSNLTFDGYTLNALHIGGISSSPSVTTGSGLSDSGSVTLSRATDLSGVINIIQLDNGNPGAGNSAVATIDFAKLYTTAPKIELQPANFNALMTNSPQSMLYVNDASNTTSAFIVSTSNTVLPSMENMSLGVSYKYPVSGSNIFSWTSTASKPWAHLMSSYTGAIGFDSTSSASNSTGTSNSLTWSHTIGSAKYLIVGLAINSISPTPTVTWNGTSMALDNQETNGNITICRYIITSPATGTHNISVSISPNVNNNTQYGIIIAYAVSFTNSGSASYTATNAGTGSSVSDTLSLSASSFAIDFIAFAGQVGLTAGNSNIQMTSTDNYTSGSGYEYQYTYLVTE